MTAATIVRPPDSEIDLAGHLCQECLTTDLGRDHDFIQSLTSSWHKGRLSDKQAHWLVQMSKRLQRSRRHDVRQLVDIGLAYVAAGNYN